MLAREDFIFTIGYDADAAVVDADAKNRYGTLSTMELAEKGLFRSAFSSALYSGDEKEQMAFISFYNGKAGTAYVKFDELKKVFGVNLENAKKAILLK